LSGILRVSRYMSGSVLCGGDSDQLMYTYVEDWDHISTHVQLDAAIVAHDV